jgi:uncharacterized protein YqjF (DUF2071 family)
VPGRIAGPARVDDAGTVARMAGSGGTPSALVGRAVSAAADIAEAAIGGLAAVWPAVGQGRVFTDTEHRPWPLPAGPWVMAQTWDDLLFAHWPVDEHSLRSLVPEPLTIDTFDGTAWLGITPFEVSGLRLRGTAPLPWLSRFPELNVRTYATFGGKPGIWFFSLDAGSAAAVVGARRTYRLPYFRADMTIARSDHRIRYDSVRASSGEPAELRVDYAPAGIPRPAKAGTLEHWLTERYCLYTLDERQRVMRAEIHHPPWPLQPATATFEANTMPPAGVDLAAQEPLLHFARRQDVVIWPLRRAATRR